MRFQLAAAYVMGVALPVLEVLRRRTNFETISGYVDDFIAGGLLLYAARAVSRRNWSQPGPFSAVGSTAASSTSSKAAGLTTSPVWRT